MLLIIQPVPDPSRAPFALDDQQPVAAAVALEANRAFFRSISTWLGDHGWRESPALPVVLALWVGPAQEYSRLIDDAEALGLGAWAALAPLLRTQPDTSLVAAGTP